MQNVGLQVVGLIVEFVRASASSQTQDECETSARSFFLRLVSRTRSIDWERKRSWKNRRKINEKTIEKSTQIDKKSMQSRSKIDEISMKVRSWAVWAPRAHSGTRLERPWDAKLGRLGGQVGWFGRRVGGSGCQVGCLECQVGPLG